MTLSVNYVIATYGGKYLRREQTDKGITESTLKRHLQKLIVLLPSTKYIKQITIGKPIVKEEVYKKYYDVQDEVNKIEELGVKVMFLRTPNKETGLSYSQWRETHKKYPDFDFYMVMEDDWIPNCSAFDSLLLDEWNKRIGHHNVPAYLCMWYAKIHNLPIHAAISVGLISKSAFINLAYHVPYSVELGQFEFSFELERAGVTIKDYSDSGHNYRLYFWSTAHGVIFDFSTHYAYKNNNTLLIPLQYDLKDLIGFDIVNVI